MTAEKAKDKKTKSEESPQPQPQPAPAAGAASDLLMEEETDVGAIRISENVIAAVVRKYTLEVDGVVRFASGSIVGGLAEMIGKKNYEGSVVVDLEDDAVNISVTLVLEFGVRIPEVAGMVQDVLRSRVEDLTGKHVTRVDVTVQDLEEQITEEGAPVPEQE